MMGLNRKGAMNARWIALRCKEQSFWKFLTHTFDTPVRNEEEAVAVVYVFGGVESRAEFDTKPEAAVRFHEVFRRPYAEYLNRAQNYKGDPCHVV